MNLRAGWLFVGALIIGAAFLFAGHRGAVSTQDGSASLATAQAAYTAPAASEATAEQPPADQPSADQPAADTPSFHGFACEEATCSGHIAGYNWAERKGIDDPHTCYHGPRLSNPDNVSFSEGCEAYVDESTGAERLDDSERYADGD